MPRSSHGLFALEARLSPDLGLLLPRIKQAEGWRARVYIDTTGNITIGYGFNLGALVLPPHVDFRDVHLEPVTALPEVLGHASVRS
jgi:hypothetical protein